MTIWDSASGMLEVALTSAEPEVSLQDILNTGIKIYHAAPAEKLTCRFQIHRRDYKALKKRCERKGEVLKICKKRGLYWLAIRSRERPVLMITILLVATLFAFLPTRVLIVKTEGNEIVATREILEAAETCGITFGASRRKVRSEKMKNALLSAIPQLRWAGINTYGCTAVISVREKQAEPEKPEKQNQVSSVVAARDGVITAITATRGNCLARVGQAVRAGEVLISGYTDCGLCIRAEQAEGEIYAQTQRSILVSTPLGCRKVAEETKQSRSFTFLLGKKRINLWPGSGIWDAGCGKMYREYWLTLPGGYRLPVGIAVETCQYRKTQPGILPPQRAEDTLRQFCNAYVPSILLAGWVQTREETISQAEGVCQLTGFYSCNEMISSVRWEQIGVINGEND